MQKKWVNLKHCKGSFFFIVKHLQLDKIFSFHTILLICCYKVCTHGINNFENLTVKIKATVTPTTDQS